MEVILHTQSPGGTTISRVYHIHTHVTRCETQRHSHSAGRARVPRVINCDVAVVSTHTRTHTHHDVTSNRETNAHQQTKLSTQYQLTTTRLSRTFHTFKEDTRGVM